MAKPRNTKLKVIRTVSPNRDQELMNLRMSVQAMRDQINTNLDGLLNRIDSILPAQDPQRLQKYKNYNSNDWGKFLRGEKV